MIDNSDDRDVGGGFGSDAGSGTVQPRCNNCGGPLAFAPGTGGLACPYCGHRQAITGEGTAARLDYESAISAMAGDESGSGLEHFENITAKCVQCNAEWTLGLNTVSGRCPFCGSPTIASGKSRKAMKPNGLLPFAIGPERARGLFREWVSRLWFAPSALKDLAHAGRPTGVFIPAWTYDSTTITDYTGERGVDYWTTETYTAFENGRSVTRSRPVKKTRWYRVSGRVQMAFSDILVLAGHSLPPKLARELEPWDLSQAKPFSDDYLSGFVTESHTVGLQEGFRAAQTLMHTRIQVGIHRDIGGDHQRIQSQNTAYNEKKFRHLLLPVWACAYTYRDRTWQFLVNARTGEVQGMRPYSWVKITLFALACLAAVGAAVLWIGH